MNITAKTLSAFIVLVSAVLVLAAPARAEDWEQMETPVTAALNGIWGSAANNVYAVGSSGTVLQYNGSDWTQIATVSGIDSNLQSVHGTSASNVYIVGSGGTILQYDGSAWKRRTSPTSNNLTGVWCSKSDVFAVGENGQLITCDATECTEGIHLTDGALNGVWGSSSSDVYAVGADGIILHFDGLQWTEMESPTTKTLYAIWGASSSEIYAVGSEGTVLRKTGTSWDTIKAISREFYAVCGTPADVSPSKLYAAGKDGKISCYSSSAWDNNIDSGTTYALQGIWISSSNDAFIVGNNGLVLLNSSNISSSNTPPTASCTVSYDSTDASTVYVNASGSTDEQTAADDLEVKWDWGDGSDETQYTDEKLATHQYTKIGTYTITLTVRDEGGLEGTATQPVTIATVSDGEAGCPAQKVLGGDDPRLESLRSFRDRILAASPAGRALIGAYYAHAGAIDAFLEENPAAAACAKKCLEGLAGIIRGLEQ